MKAKHLKILNSLILCSICVLFFAGCDISLQLTDLDLKSKNQTMKYINTFKIDKCDKITLHYYKKMSDQRDGISPKSAEIKDKAILEKILLLMNKLSDKGDKMVKMGDVPILDVIITIDKSETVYFTYYQMSVKTTDTSFYSNPQEEEKVLFEFLNAILNK